MSTITAPAIKQGLPTLDWLDICRWGVQELDLVDREEIYHSLNYGEIGNDSYYVYWLETKYEEDDSVVYRFKKLLQQQYNLTEDDQIMMEVCW